MIMTTPLLLWHIAAAYGVTAVALVGGLMWVWKARNRRAARWQDRP